MSSTSLELTADAVQFQCRHIRPDGRRCGSPSLRHQHFCYHHDRTRRQGPRQPQVNSARAARLNAFNLPIPADLAERAGLQLAVAQILGKISNNEIDPRRAGLLLYGIQIASALLPKGRSAGSEAGQEEVVDEVVLDPELGSLAPEAEWTEDAGRPQRTLERWIEEMETESAASRSCATRSLDLEAQDAASGAEMPLTPVASANSAHIGSVSAGPEHRRHPRSRSVVETRASSLPPTDQPNLASGAAPTPNRAQRRCAARASRQLGRTFSRSPRPPSHHGSPGLPAPHATLIKDN